MQGGVAHRAVLHPLLYNGMQVGYIIIISSSSSILAISGEGGGGGGGGVLQRSTKCGSHHRCKLRFKSHSQLHPCYSRMMSGIGKASVP